MYKYESQLGSTNVEQFDLLKGLPFYSDWISFIKTDHVDFNHAIGLPQKNGQSYPLFDYEQMLFDTLQKHKHVWIKKATGLGITEFMLRYMAWLCFTSPNIWGSKGPRIELAITLIDRMKGLFRDSTKKRAIFGGITIISGSYLFWI